TWPLHSSLPIPRPPAIMADSVHDQFRIAQNLKIHEVRKASRLGPSAPLAVWRTLFCPGSDALEYQMNGCSKPLFGCSAHRSILTRSFSKFLSRKSMNDDVALGHSA